MVCLQETSGVLPAALGVAAAAGASFVVLSEVHFPCLLTLRPAGLIPLLSHFTLW